MANFCTLGSLLGILNDIMIVAKSLSLVRIMAWTAGHIIWLLLASTGIALLYRFGYIEVALPWTPISVIGTAVAFYIGFKNNQSYDRMWEARKIWGGIVNDSRTWGMQIDGYVTDQFSASPIASAELQAIKKRLIYRHIAWLYTHRNQLLAPTVWEHISQRGATAHKADFYQRRFGVGLVEKEAAEFKLENYVDPKDAPRLAAAKNTATQLVNAQSRDLTELRAQGIIDDFRHTQLMTTLRSFYALQGKNERIKKFPLPRQYANMSRYFVAIFLFLLPFSMIPALMELGQYGFELSVLITALIGWVYVMMEVVGDYSENPFQGMAHDIPMLSLCRTIEIDLREMLNETDLPAPIAAKQHVLM